MVEALADNSRAHVQVADNNPGTRVSIIHAQIAGVENEDARKFEGPGRLTPG